ncbi:MAG TPA: hormogonium polysaccharide biosynthesis protein HpsA, partial [Trichocoleus sp.]
MSSLNRRLRRLTKLPRFWAKRFMTGMLRALMISNRPDRLGRAGFVLPTTILLLLVVTLSAGALTYRAFSRSDQAIALREQKVITNAATPAVDRAKAKIEYLFQRDERIPGGLPSSDVLAALMIAPGVDLDPSPTSVNFGVVAKSEDIYTLPDETRMDINNDGVLDNAWFFRSDLNGDGTADDDEVIAYSVLMDDEAVVPGTTTTKRVTDAEDTNKARALVTRTGPVSTSRLTNKCRAARAPEGGWQIVNSSRDTLQKNFQVNAFVLNRGAGSDVNRTVQTLEFQQSREAARGSKWGAWFRYDLEVFPGPVFKWNGAMHAASNLFVQDNFKGYMVSSNDSCIYSDTASEITLGNEPNDPTTAADETFRGEFVRGTSKTNTFVKGPGTPEFHFFNGAAYPRVGGNGLQLDDNTDTASDKDSVRARGSSAPTWQDVAVNPITLFTQGISKNIDATTWEHDTTWDASQAVTRRRIYNKRERKPFVDDFFRADNRWGPKPDYKNFDLRQAFTNSGGTVTLGSPINTTTYPGLVDGEGLDGFWERQAIATGLRMIVGQRLELGNTFGWNVNPSDGTFPASGGATNDPLYPPNALPVADNPHPNSTPGNNTTYRNYPGGVHEALQRKSLRDNLAAVQAMAVYHYETNNGQFPLACYATTAHPGTQRTVINSRTFGTWASSGTARTDFFKGVGTNGWEFKYNTAFDTPGEFRTQVVATAPLGTALRNLAYFAGDPNGGAPSFQPVQDNVVHPYPQQAMWGDFSPLRRIIDAGGLNSAAAFDALSPADKATVHTAACTLGMLAYNIDEEAKDYLALNNYTVPANFQNMTSKFGNMINDLISYMRGGSISADTLTRLQQLRLDRTSWGSATRCPSYNQTTFLNDAGAGPGTVACGSADYFAAFTLNDWIAVAATRPSGQQLDQAEIDILIQVAERVSRLETLIRDRDLGFRRGATQKDINPNITTRPVDWDAVTEYTEAVGPQSNNTNVSVFRVKCDPNIFRGVSAGGGGGDNNVIMAGVVACSNRNVSDVRFPALYYLFPMLDHDHDGEDYHAQPGGAIAVANQPGEEYITQTYIQNQNNAVGRFKVVGAATTDPVLSIVRGAGAIASVPAPTTVTSGWTLPVATAAALTDPDDADQAFRITINTGTPTGATVPFLDKGMYDGREQLSLRVLDLDIGRLASTRNGTGDFWLPSDRTKNAEGIVYAFREDAVREDEIVRPKNASATVTADYCSALAPGVSNPKQFRLENDATCRMNALPGSLQDPPLTDVRISLKPVDFYPDPERRPYGFRFRNGADVSNNKARRSGITFVTDNSVYILGNFNLHSTDGTPATLIEEFTDKLSSKTTWAETDFYANGGTGRVNTELDTDNFANLEVDRWRPVEILADAVGILSGNFKDGNVGDTFVTPTPGADSDRSEYSYQNQNRPYFEGNTQINAENWIQENEWQGVLAAATTGTQRESLLTPVRIDRNGGYSLKTPQTSPILGGVAQFLSFGNSNLHRRNLIRAQTTTVNATIVSGVVPARPNQAYGGLHNFPRFNEGWETSGGADIPLNY